MATLAEKATGKTASQLKDTDYADGKTREDVFVSRANAVRGSVRAFIARFFGSDDMDRERRRVLRRLEKISRPRRRFWLFR